MPDYVCVIKGEFNGAATGPSARGISAVNLLDILTDRRKGTNGIFPELVLLIAMPATVR